LQSKLRKLEDDLSQIDRQMGGGGRGAHHKEDKELIDSLNSQVSKLKNANAALNNKVEQLTDAFEKKKRELNLLKKTAYLGKGRATAHNNKAVDENNMELEVLPGKNPQLEMSVRKPSTPMKPSMTSTATTPMPQPPANHHAQHDSQLLDIAQKQKSK
jgi:chromosome segregation ATPase